MWCKKPHLKLCALGIAAKAHIARSLCIVGFGYPNFADLSDSNVWLGRWEAVATKGKATSNESVSRDSTLVRSMGAQGLVPHWGKAYRLRYGDDKKRQRGDPHSEAMAATHHRLARGTALCRGDTAEGGCAINKTYAANKAPQVGWRRMQGIRSVLLNRGRDSVPLLLPFLP